MKPLLYALVIIAMLVGYPFLAYLDGKETGRTAAQAQCAADTQAAADVARAEFDRARQAELDDRQRIHDEALQMQRRAAADAAAAERSRHGLQQRANATAAAISARACAPAAAQPAGPPASAPELVLADVLGWADGRAADAAAAADAAHAAGVICEREHDAVAGADHP